MIELILFVIAMTSTLALLISLLYMNWLINTLYEFGLGFSYEWAGPYYLTLRLGFALLSIIVITSLSMVIVYRRLSKVKVPSVEREQTLMKRVQELRLELWKYKRKPSGVVGSVILLFGTIAFVLSIIYESSVLAFIGLGLILWGALLLFIRPTRYVRSKLLNSMTVSPLTTIHQLMKTLIYKGKGIYLPPEYLKEPNSVTIFIPSKKGITTLPIEKGTKGKASPNPQGIVLTPTGLSLANLYEEELGVDFAKVDLLYLQSNLPKLFIEGLKIAGDFEMGVEGDTIRARITGTIVGELCQEARKIPNICSLGCPLCSSIACALTKATGKPVIIDENQVSEDGRVIEVIYRTLGTNPSKDFPFKEQTEAAPAEVSVKKVSTVPAKPL